MSCSLAHCHMSFTVPFSVHASGVVPRLHYRLLTLCPGAYYLSPHAYAEAPICMHAVAQHRAARFQLPLPPQDVTPFRLLIKRIMLIRA